MLPWGPWVFLGVSPRVLGVSGCCPGGSLHDSGGPGGVQASSRGVPGYFWGTWRCPQKTQGCPGATPGVPGGVWGLTQGPPDVSGGSRGVPKGPGGIRVPPGGPRVPPWGWGWAGVCHHDLEGRVRRVEGAPKGHHRGLGVLPGVPGDKKPPPYPPPGAPHLQVSMYNELLVTVLHGRHYLQERGCHGGVPKGPQGVRGPPRGSLGGVLSPPTCRNLARASFSFMRPWATR